MIPTLILFFVCETSDQATQVVTDHRDRGGLVTGVSPLPQGCRWVNHEGLPRQAATVEELVEWYEVSPDLIVWVARVKRYDGREAYSAGVVPLLVG